VRFAQSLGEPAFAPRAALGGGEGLKDARTLARAGPERSRRKLLAMSPAEFSAAFKGSPMKRAKRRGLACNAAAALGNVGTAEDVPAPEAALAHDEPLPSATLRTVVREHPSASLTAGAAWALQRLRTRTS
jgi:epoxyqueuosine reductase